MSFQYWPRYMVTCDAEHGCSATFDDGLSRDYRQILRDAKAAGWTRKLQRNSVWRGRMRDYCPECSK